MIARRTWMALAAGGVLAAGLARPASAQTPSSPSAPPGRPDSEPAVQAPQHQHEHGVTGPTWQFMQDGAIFGTYNRQGGRRGSRELQMQNWWMGMGSRLLRSGTLTLTGMFSLEPVSLSEGGYGEIFQVGETYNGAPLVDRQHPHDFVMQLSAAWRVNLGQATTLTVAVAPIGEAALGPVAFMHRPSAAENPTAPLGHHSFDSTHITMGVISGAVQRGAVTFEGSVFRGREPDANRWDIMDPGPLDSWSARVWVRPTTEWSMQLSHGFLQEPEELEPGDTHRTTASIDFFRQRSSGFTAIFGAWGRNKRDEGSRQALLGEVTHRVRKTSIYARAEVLQVESDLLLSRSTSHSHGVVNDSVGAFTLGGVRELAAFWGFELGLGGDVTLYRVAERLKSAYGSHPVSWHAFLRLRLPAPAGRMWNMQMLEPHGGKHAR